MTALDWVLLVLPLLFALFLLRRWRQGSDSFSGTFGVTVDRRLLPDVAVGLAIGAAVMLAVLLSQLILGASRITGIQGPGIDWWGWLLFLLIASGIEELFNRSFLLNGLVALMRGGTWIAIGISAVIFGIAHMGNPNASPVSVVGNTLGGVMYAVAFLGSGRIWMAWSLHLSWNFFQGQVFGWPVSGLVVPSLLQQSTPGPDWVTGGDYGPEAGAVGLTARFLILAALFGWFKLRSPDRSWSEVLLFRKS